MFGHTITSVMTPELLCRTVLRHFLVLNKKKIAFAHTAKDYSDYYSMFMVSVAPHFYRVISNVFIIARLLGA